MRFARVISPLAVTVVLLLGACAGTPGPGESGYGSLAGYLRVSR